ncbi:MAG: CDP-2,3-bis-(O-geranylgeranyl)-sn-glycerol synthase [Nanoarchaeota archaeon]
MYVIRKGHMLIIYKYLTKTLYTIIVFFVFKMLFFILQCLYLMLPAYCGNMAPVIVKNYFNFLKIPIDFNKTLNGKPIFGKNKTYRGLIFGILVAVIISYLQFQLTGIDFFRKLSFVDYSDWLAIGIFMGLGALLGDLIESFFKRRFGIKSGSPWIPWDQLDFVVGSIIFISIVYHPTLTIILTIISLSFFLHIVFSNIGYYLKLKKDKY